MNTTTSPFSMKQLWNDLKTHLALICTVLAVVTTLVSIWFSLIATIASFVLGTIAAVLQYRDKKIQQQEKQLIDMQLHRAETAAEEMYNKPYYAAPVKRG